MKQAILINEKLSFKGDTKAILKYKTEVEACLNQTGIIDEQTFGTYTLKFGKKKITVPKTWVEILD
jgi:hypothetical protein